MPTTSTFLVDDSPSFLQSAARFLTSDERIEIVGVARSASEALTEVARLQPALVLMDLNMPGMNGLEATRLLKAGPNPPHIVILTLHDTQEYRLAALQAQADGFVTKSDFGQDLLPLLESFLARSQDTLPEPLPAAVGAALGVLAAASTCEPPAPASSSTPAVAAPAVAAVVREDALPFAMQAPAFEASAAWGSGERRRVLLAEDQVSISHLMAVSLWRAGIETRTAPDPLAALELLENFAPHLIVVDAASPRMKAASVCRSIRARSGVPILLVATRAEAARGAWCIASTPSLAFLQGAANVEQVFACAENVAALTERVLGLLA